MMKDIRITVTIPQREYTQMRKIKDVAGISYRKQIEHALQAYISNYLTQKNYAKVQD